MTQDPLAGLSLTQATFDLDPQQGASPISAFAPFSPRSEEPGPPEEDIIQSQVPFNLEENLQRTEEPGPPREDVVQSQVPFNLEENLHGTEKVVGDPAKITALPSNVHVSPTFTVELWYVKSNAHDAAVCVNPLVTYLDFWHGRLLVVLYLQPRS
jgi:hypothetical protein